MPPIVPDEFEEIPEYYTDSVNFMTNIYSFMVEFGAQQPNPEGLEPPPPRPLVRVKMSPHHAKIMSLMLRKQVREYETRIGTIILPTELFQSLGISDD
jgi:hypothetical protein